MTPARMELSNPDLSDNMMMMTTFSHKDTLSRDVSIGWRMLFAPDLETCESVGDDLAQFLTKGAIRVCAIWPQLKRLLHRLTSRSRPDVICSDFAINS